MTQPWVGEEFPKELQHFCQHVLAIQWYEGRRGEDGEYTERPTPQVATAVIVEVGGALWLLTAGHIFTERRQQKEKGIGYSRVSISDAWSPTAPDCQPIPFDIFDPGVELFIFDDRGVGVDLAAILLPELPGQALKQSIKPFFREDWLEADGKEFRDFFLLGFPGCLADVVIADQPPDRKSMTTHLCPYMIRVHPIQPGDATYERVRGSLPTDELLNPFVAQVDDRYPLESIQGMSGGPIFGFMDDPEGIRYFPVAIQSYWLPQKRIAVATPLVASLSGFEWALENAASDGSQSASSSRIE